MKNPNRIYKSVAAITILIFVVYSVIGIVLVFFKKFDFEDFITWFGIWGGVVSVVSLLSFFQRSTTKDDLKELQLDTLREIADSSRKLESVEEARQAVEKNINTLEIQRQQMEVLIKKASLSLFLQEQHNLYNKKIVEAVNSDNELSGNLKKLLDIDSQLEALEEQISKDENVDLLKEIIREVKRKEDSGTRLTIDFGSPILNIAYKAIENAANMAKILISKGM